MRAHILLLLALTACTRTEAKPIARDYAWLPDTELTVYDSLEQRFPEPDGFARVSVRRSSFGAFLRTLPLAPPGTPVVSYAGKALHDGAHPNIAAVVAIDIGKTDSQQCADSIIRLHAEWRWSLGKHDHRYQIADGRVMSFANYLSGERFEWHDGALVTKYVDATTASHAALRSFLEQVFGAANTASLASEAEAVDENELRPGDFVVMKGVPFGHAVLILDVARNVEGKRVVLLGQGFMPAQSFHVLRRSPSEAWFPIDMANGRLETPFWKPFPLTALRRL